MLTEAGGGVTIERGKPWGDEVARPPDLRVVAGDQALVAALAEAPGRPVSISAGDLHRTLGAPQVGDREVVRELRIDLLEVTLDDGATRRAVAHVVARAPWWRGSWFRGPVLAVMNAEFHGDWDVAPRGHPNDGRAEAQLADADLPLRDRWAARSRLAVGGHVPHPSITTRSIRRASWTFPTRLAIFVDGCRAGRSRSVAVEVLPDAATIYA